MRFDLITIFPEFFAGPLEHGIVRRAREAGLIETRVHDLRQWAHDRHSTVDDRPFGGGEGMVMKPEPIFEAVESMLGETPAAPSAAPAAAIVLLSASGKLFRQAAARELAACKRILFICGRYEGVDERVAEHLATHELSIGNFVLSGGELPAAMVLDAVTRLLPGALGNEDSCVNESFSSEVASDERRAAGEEKAEGGRQKAEISNYEFQIPSTHHSPLVTHHSLLDCPHYTRPAEFRGWRVPEVLLSGNHDQIRRWRAAAALEKTRRNRPDLLRGGG